MSEFAQTPVIKIISPEDGLDVIPTLVGFYPTESLCAIIVSDTDTPSRTRRKVTLVTRADLPTTSPEAIEAAKHIEHAVKTYRTGALVMRQINEKP